MKSSHSHTSNSVVIPASLQWPITWFFHWSMFLKLRNSHWLHFSLLIWQKAKQSTHFLVLQKSLEHTNLFSIWSFKVKFILVHPRGWLLSHLDVLDRICNMCNMYFSNWAQLVKMVWVEYMLIFCTVHTFPCRTFGYQAQGIVHISSCLILSDFQQSAAPIFL